MIKSKRNISVLLFALCAVAAFVAAIFFANSQKVFADENMIYLTTVYSPGNDGVTTSGSGISTQIVGNSSYGGNLLRINRVADSSTNSVTILLPKKADCTFFEGYAVWLSLSDSSDSYSFTLMINDQASASQGEFGFVSKKSGDYNYNKYTTKTMPWKRLTGINGFCGWMVIPKQLYTSVSPADGNVRFTLMVENVGSPYVRTGSVQIDVGQILAYENFGSLAYQICGNEQADIAYKAELQSYFSKINALTPKTAAAVSAKKQAAATFGEWDENWNKYDANTKIRVIDSFALTYNKFIKAYKSGTSQLGNKLMSFATLSDMHITGSANWGNYISVVKDAIKNDPSLDAIIALGDLSDHGMTLNDDTDANNDLRLYYNLYAGETVDGVYAGTVKWFNVLGNHDVRGNSATEWNKSTAQYTDKVIPFYKDNDPFYSENETTASYDYWLEGYHFIFLNTDVLDAPTLKDNCYLNNTTLNWLENAIESNEAGNGKADPNRPVFIMVHQPSFKNGGDATGMVISETANRFESILKDHSNCICWSGHTHYNFGSANMIYQAEGDSVYVNQGSTYHNSKVYYLVEVYERGVVLTAKQAETDKSFPDSDIIEFAYEDLQSLEMKNGASVRYEVINGNGGIRFAYTMDADDYDTLMSKTGEGKLYSEISFGMVIAPKSYTDIHPLNITSLFGKGNSDTRKWYTWEGENAVNCAMIINFSSLNAVREDGKVVFTAAMTDIKDGSSGAVNNIDRSFTGLGYLKFEYNDVSCADSYMTVNPYGGDIKNNQRSICYVAQVLLDETGEKQPTEEQKEWLTLNYLSKVADKTAKYYVNYIKCDEKGEYETERRLTFTGNIGEEVNVTPDTVEGFKFNADKSILSGRIVANDKLELNLYFDRVDYLAGSYIKRNAFEETSDVKSVFLPDASKEVWSLERSGKVYYSGNSSLKIEVNESSSTKWPYLILTGSQSSYVNLRSVASVSVWVYYTGVKNVPIYSDGWDTVFALKFQCEGASAFYSKNFGSGELKPYVWTEIKVSRDEILSGLYSADSVKYDITRVQIQFLQNGAVYNEKYDTYLDDFEITYLNTWDFEGAKDACFAKEDYGDLLPSISADYAKNGNTSLKLTPYAQTTWPRLELQNGADGNYYDFTSADTISFWIYNSNSVDIYTSESGVDSLYCIEFNDGSNNYRYWLPKLAANSWTFVSIDLSAVSAEMPNLNMSKAKLLIIQNGGKFTYKNPVYIDEFAIA